MFDLIPFGRNERNLFNYLDNVERSFWDGSISNMAQFRCDVQDKGDSYLLEAELPGFEREDIGIDLDGTTLVITARHSSESGEKDKDGNYLRRERKFGSFSRSFDVSGVDTEHISAAYKNGVLELTLPKQAAQVPQARRIERPTGLFMRWMQCRESSVLYWKALRAVLPARSARPVRTFQRPDLPVPTEHKAGGSTQQSQ